jgi:hypothetical protein
MSTMQSKRIWPSAALVTICLAARALEFGPDECRWCERSDLNRVDRSFRDAADGLDSPAMGATRAVATALIPLGALGLSAPAARREGAERAGRRGWPSSEIARIAQLP